MAEIVAYYRVSTQMQGFHGLGMAAQRHSVQSYAANCGALILAEYEEVETGRRETLRNRPQLSKAVAHARRSKATLVIARFDRLARNVLVTAQLLESGVEFVACDNPHANRMTIQIMAVMAENESRLISERTKAAFAARKARGLPDSSGRKFTTAESLKGRLAAARSHRERAATAYRFVTPIVVQMRSRGVGLREIVEHLNGLGERNQNGSPFDVACVRRILGWQGVDYLPTFLARDTEAARSARRKGQAACMSLALAKSKAASDMALPAALDLVNLGISGPAIATRLNDLGLRNSHGGLWRSPTVHKLLGDHRPVVRGKCTPEQVKKRTNASIRCKRKSANEAFEPIFQIVAHLRELSLGYRAIATVLNSLGYRRRDGALWKDYSVAHNMRRHYDRRMFPLVSDGA